MSTYIAPICPICKTNRCTVDGEGGVWTHFSWCDTGCFDIVSCAPYCYHPDCSGGSRDSRTVLVNAGPGITKDTAIFACPNGHGQATRIGWKIGSGRDSARYDVEAWAAREFSCLEVRLSPRGLASGLTAEHPETRAYANAYVDTAIALIMGENALVGA